MAASCKDFAQFTLKLFHDVVLNNAKYVGLIKSQAYTMPTYYMGMVDENNKVNFYDGKIRVVDPKGQEFLKFDCQDYLNHIGEHVEEWTYSKFPYLKAVGWKGQVAGIRQRRLPCWSIGQTKRFKRHGNSTWRKQNMSKCTRHSAANQSTAP